MENCEAMTSSPHSFAYSYRLVKKYFLKMCETSKCHNLLIFQLIFIRFSLLCLKMFTLSSEIKLNLLWSSSLRFSNSWSQEGAMYITMVKFWGTSPIFLCNFLNILMVSDKIDAFRTRTTVKKKKKN